VLTERRRRRAELENRQHELDDRDARLRQRDAELHQRAAEIDRVRREAAEKAWGDAKELISISRKKMNALLEELKREKRGDIVDKLRQNEAELTDKLKPRDARPDLLPLEAVKAGDNVHIRTLGCDGQILSMDERSGKARVRAGRMELDVLLAELAKPQAKADGGRSKTPAGSWKVNVEENDQRELKLIGMRVEQALSELESFISHAAAAGMREVRVIHGIGTGRLREAVREELERHPLVEAHRPGEPHEGRDGATVVTVRV